MTVRVDADDLERKIDKQESMRSRDSNIRQFSYYIGRKDMCSCPAALDGKTGERLVPAELRTTLGDKRLEWIRSRE